MNILYIYKGKRTASFLCLIARLSLNDVAVRGGSIDKKLKNYDSAS